MAGVPACILAAFWMFLWLVPSIDAQDTLQKAVMLVQQGRLDEAAQQAQLALSDPEARAAAYSVLGGIRLQQKRLADSAALLQKAIEIEPRLLGAHLNLAQVYTLQGRSDLAIGQFRRVLDLDPLNAAARLALARLFPAGADVRYTSQRITRDALDGYRHQSAHVADTGYQGRQ